MHRKTKVLLVAALLATVVVVGLVWFLPRPFTAPDCQGGITAVGETMVQYVAGPGGLLVVVWSDFSDKDQRSPGFRGEGGSTTHFAGSSGRTEWHSTVKAADGRAVQLKLVTTDGKTWTATVNDKQYALEDGTLFLVRTRSGSARVTQVKHDLSGLEPTAATWQRLAQENADVKNFTAQAGVKE